MPVWVIDTLKPKNGLDFPVVEAIDVAVEGYSSLADAVTHFATDTAIDALTAALDSKADKTTTDSLQAQIDQIAQAAGTGTADTEIAQARVGADGTTYTTLKERLDTEDGKINNDLISTSAVISCDDTYNPFEWEAGSYRNVSVGQAIEKNNSEDALRTRKRLKNVVTLEFATALKAKTGYSIDILQVVNNNITAATGYIDSADLNRLSQYAILLRKNDNSDISSTPISSIIDAPIANTQIIKNKVAIDNLKKDNLLSEIAIGNLEEGYITSSGTVSPLSTIYHTDYISINAGYKYTIKNPTDSFSDSIRIAFYSKTKEVISTIDYSTMVDGRIQFIPPAGSFYIRFSIKDGYQSLCKFLFDVGSSINAIDTELAAIETQVDKLNKKDIPIGDLAEGYITTSGNVGSLNTVSHTDYLDISAGYKYAISNPTDTFSNAVRIAFYDENKTTISTIDYSTMVDGVITFTTPAASKYIRFTIKNGYEDICKFSYFIDETIEVLMEAVSELQDFDVQLCDFSLFENFGVVGDSYASGEIYVNNTPTDFYNMSWGQILARKCGNQCTNFSAGGLSTKTWLTNTAHGLALLNSENAKQLYICAMGLNDYTQGAEYLGTLEDIGTDADTFYGNYSKIIDAIKAKSPKAKIILSTMANDATTVKADFNAAIIAIANYYEIPYIDQRESAFFTSNFYRNNLPNAHPIGCVYSGMACAIKEMIEKEMEENVSYFSDYNGQL